MKSLNEAGLQLDIESDGIELCPECDGTSQSCVACDGMGFIDMNEEKDRHVEGSRDFDKFMGRILQEEKRSGPAAVMTDSPQRVRAARHQDRPLNRIRIGTTR